MRAKLLFPAILAALLCLTACDIADWGNIERFSKDFHYSYPMNANGKLEAETFNGSVEISGWDQPTVDISGTKYGPTQGAADDLRVDIDHSPDAVSIRVVKPSTPRNRLGAKLVIKVPRTAILDRITSSNGSIHTLDGVGPARLKTSNGSIHVEGLRGSLDAQTSNSSVELVDVEGDVIARTSNGRIRADRLKGALDADTSNSSVRADIVQSNRAIRVETSNGSVDLTLPARFGRDVRVNTNNSSITLRAPGGLNAHVLARTSNSSISSDFEMAMRGEISKNSMDATVGSGGPVIDLTTSNGSIRLVRRAAGAESDEE